MKFSTLISTQRSALAALCNSGILTTDKLAKVMDTDPQGAANVLCQMRKIGLVYSMEKGSRTYAPWAASEIGMQLFANRPNHTLVYVTDAELAMLEGKGQPPKAQQITKFAVVTNFQTDATGTKEQALLAAEELAIRTGQKVVVIGLCAEVTPPEQPRAQITLL